jgi:hypothetical protein
VTTAAERLEDRLSVEQITPQRALVMLLTGVLPEEEILKFRPSRLSLDSLAKLLDRRTSDKRNRKVSIPRVQRMARDMSNANWKFTGDTIKLDESGFVIDGQHRLLAIFLSGTKQYMALLSNADSETQLVVDTGRPRTAADQLGIRGAKHARHTSAAGALLLRWRSGQIMNSQFHPTITEITQFVESTPTLVEGATMAMRVLTHIKHAPVTSLIVTYVEACEKVTPELRDYFFQRLERGDELAVHDPILTLRNTFNRYTPDRPVPFRMIGRLWQITHAWNKWRAGEKIQMLRVPQSLSSDSFPTMK